MNEIKCPKCGQVFQVDENGYAAMIKQVRDKEFAKDIKAREEQLLREKQNDIEIAKLAAEKEFNAKLNEKEKELALKEQAIIELLGKVTAADKEKELAVSEAVKNAQELLAEKEKAITKLQGEQEIAQKEKELEENHLKEEYERKLKEKEQIEEERREKELNKKSKLWGTIITCVIFGVPYIILLSVTELLKGYFPNISWYSIVAVAVLILATAIVGICFKRLNALCIEIVRKKLQKRMRVEE